MHQRKLFEISGPIAGVDEAGRGPLAGPVVAAAVILAPDQDATRYRDSKTLGARTRQMLADEIRSRSLCWSVATADRAEIDALNILQATMLAMRRAVLGLSVLPNVVRVDGNRLPDLCIDGRSIPATAEVRGDGRIAAISAASILAKTARDQIMIELDARYPQYGFAQHKGYCTVLHRQRLAEFGPCDEHRTSFAPVRAARRAG